MKGTIKLNTIIINTNIERFTHTAAKKTYKEVEKSIPIRMDTNIFQYTKFAVQKYLS